MVIWAALKQRFSTSDDTQVHQLRAELAACRQEGQTVEEYFGKLKVYWDDLSDFEAAFTCSRGNDRCSSMTKYCKIQDKTFIHQFLMGLNNSRFGTARSNLLSRLGELTLESVYSHMKQEETHLNTTQRTHDKSSVIGFSATAAAITKLNTSMTCTHCGRTGHEKQQCFKLVGYQGWWGEQLTLGRGNSCRGRGSVRGRNKGGNQVGLLGSHPASSHTTEASTSTASDSGILNLTQSQWNSITNFMTSKKQNNTDKISFSQLLDAITSYVIFTKRFCAIQDQASRTLIGAGEKSNGVYHLTGAVVHQAHRVGRSGVAPCGTGVWKDLLLEKSEVADVLKNFIAFVHRQFNKHVKIIRSDNGTEFICLCKFFDSQELIHQTSCVVTPQQNGRVERKHRHILNVARSLLLEAKLPARFWGESF
ncbi:PREDICTED: uncharacterized protein LOC109127342 [Camelina sativa]|uniref:Uncharacterized protein LOC109127342 n=1 Tax=Camelina sativa TaxID=90675 RepID=A0ABM1QL55_CAMSA|nr:PREDICTED: uncharacterized protein LOC109127342 [Camelina sativa]